MSVSRRPHPLLAHILSHTPVPGPFLPASFTHFSCTLASAQARLAEWHRAWTGPYPQPLFA